MKRATEHGVEPKMVQEVEDTEQAIEANVMEGDQEQAVKGDKDQVVWKMTRIKYWRVIRPKSRPW